MYIAQLIDSLSLGGAQILIKTFAEVILQGSEERHRLAVISLGFNTGSSLPEELRAMGVAVYCLPTRRLLDWSQVVRLGRLIFQQRFDVIHTHLPRAHILGALWGRMSGTPVVSTLHSTGEEQRHYNPARYRLESLALRFGAQAVIAVGHAVADAHRQRLASRRILVVPNAVRPVPPLDDASRTNLRQALAGDAARPLLIAVGRLLPPKAYKDLLVAMTYLLREHPRAYLVIVGDGDLKTDLQVQIRALGLTESVALLGARADVPRLLAAADVFVSSSQREGLPLAVLEAMSAGLPVVATAVGDLPRLVTPTRGLLVPVHQPEALAEAITSLLSDSTRRLLLGQAGQDYVLREHAPQVWVERLLMIYQQVAMSKAKAER